MHLEILADRSGSIALDVVLEKIFGENRHTHSWALHPYKGSYPGAGKAKHEWARRIAPHMDVDRNRSKSFQVFRDGVRRLAGMR